MTSAEFLYHVRGTIHNVLWDFGVVKGFYRCPMDTDQGWEIIMASDDIPREEKIRIATELVRLWLESANTQAFVLEVATAIPRIFRDLRQWPGV